MSENKIEILLAVKDKATADIEKSTNKISSLNDKVQKSYVNLAAKIFIAQQAYRAISRVVGTLITQAAQHEDAINRLNNALQIQGTYTEGLSLKYQEFADNMQKLTRYGNTQVLELMQQLIAVGNVSEDQMERAAKAAMDFATATGRDLKTAALTVGKAMSGFTGELSRYGIILDANIPQTQKAEAALKAMERQFGTAAQRDINTFGGAVDQLNNSWQDLQKELGRLITESPEVRESLKLIRETVESLTQAVAKLNAARKEGFDLKEALLHINPIVSGLLTGFSRWETDIHNANAGLGMMEYNLGVIKIRKEEINDLNKESFEFERESISVITALHNNLTKEIIKYRETEFKDLKQKAEAKKVLDQSILNTQITNLETLLAKNAETNKAAAVAFKAIQISRAIINTHEAITEALPNLPLAALVGAMGAAEIASIVATKFARGTDTVPAMLTPGEMVIPRDFATAIRSGDLSLSGKGGSSFGDINIFIQGGVNPNGSSVDEMAEQLGFAFEREIRTARGV
jgi:hypothetical protein